MSVALPAPVGNWLTIDEAAKRLGMTTQGVRHLVARKQISGYRFGRALAFRDLDVEKVASRPPTTGRPRQGYAKRKQKPARSR
jgi:excisionase family DNA binding protein